MEHHPVKISAVIITYNEEKNIERCLKSLQGIADEIVVVDSYSTDRTKEICESFNVRFLLHPFDGHIQQKNYAVAQACHEYILSLDADEALSPTLQASILEVKNKWEKDGYEFNRLTNYCGSWIKYAGWYPDTKLRLWKKVSGKWGGTNPHDKLILNKGTSKGLLKGDLLHYSFYSIAEHIAQINYFSDIAAKEAFSKGKNASFIQTILNPLFVFVKKYFFQRGFIGGWTGFTICVISAFGKFLKYIKLRELKRGD